MKVTVIAIVIGALGTITKGLLLGLEDIEISGKLETIQANIGQNTEESSVSQTPVRNRQLTLV